MDREGLINTQRELLDFIKNSLQMEGDERSL